MAATDDWMRAVAQRGLSGQLWSFAREKGAFPLYDRDAYLASGTMQAMDADVRAAVAEHGIRKRAADLDCTHGHEISLYAGNVSSGIEPIFATSYTRKVLQKGTARAPKKWSRITPSALWRQLPRRRALARACS